VGLEVRGFREAWFSDSVRISGYHQCVALLRWVLPDSAVCSRDDERSHSRTFLLEPSVCVRVNVT
jgi:hypothetical protein